MISSLIIPKQRTISDVVKIFVRTGGEWDECAVKMPIEVDLVQAGKCDRLVMLAAYALVS